MAMTSASPLDLVLANFEAAWRSGSQPRAEAWVDQLDSSRPTEATELIYHEFCLAEADGLSPRFDDYLERFPEHRVSLSRLFELHSLTSGVLADHLRPPSALPWVGDTIGPYRLCRLLGEGSFAGVFLAEETDLGGRYVVVKVTTRPSPEPRLLARARHAHIVEVLRHGKTPDGAFQLIFMPFLGGATLLAVASETLRRGFRPRSGRDFLARLDHVSAREYPAADVTRPAREILSKLSYPKAVGYIFARLAEALDHAYRQGVAHGDVKPSNILLTADGLPMLFDFNLAIDCLDAEATLGGGTLAYMPPERLRAIDRSRDSESDLTGSIDLHRADLYALGLVLVETLTGVAPSMAQGPPRVMAEARDGGVTVFSDWRNLPIPSGLRPILAQCLAADPAERYPDGRALAADLDRWRSDLPPLSAPDGVASVRLTRWVSRRRVVVATGVLTLIAALGAGAVISGKYQSTIRDRAEARYAQVLDKNDLNLFDFRQFGAWANPATDPAELATRKLNTYDVLNDPHWRDRDDVRTLSEPHRADLELMMLEHVYRLATAYAERPDSKDDWRRALDLLDRECRHVSASALEIRRRDLRAKLCVSKPPVSSPDRSQVWIEEYLLGVAAEPVHSRAFTHYEKAIEARPELLWPRYRGSVAACRIAHYRDAVTHLRVATTLRPDNPALHTHLASVLLRTGRLEEAYAECDRAIALDPDFAMAYFDRTYIDNSLDRSDLSKQDVARLSLLVRSSVRAIAEKVHYQTLSYDRLIGHGVPDSDSKIDDVIRKLHVADPSDPEIRVNEAARLGGAGQVNDAITSLDAILQDHPEHLRARYHRAIFLRMIHHPKAVEEYAALIEDPRFEELYPEQPNAVRFFHHVTNDCLREGQFEKGRAIAERGLVHSLRTRQHLAESYYALGRILAASAPNDPGRLDQARERLQQAIDLNPKLRNWYWKDRFLLSLRKADPTFLRPERDLGADLDFKTP